MKISLKQLVIQSNEVSCSHLYSRLARTMKFLCSDGSDKYCKAQKYITKSKTLYILINSKYYSTVYLNLIILFNIKYSQLIYISPFINIVARRMHEFQHGSKRCRRAICRSHAAIRPKMALHNNAYLSVLYTNNSDTPVLSKSEALQSNC